MMETQAATHCCIKPFRWKSLRGWDFRPQLIIVSGLFGGNPFVDGILGHNLLLSQAFSVGIPSWIDFRQRLIVVSGLFGGNPFVDGILGFPEPFSQPVVIFTMEFWLSGSPSHELFLFFTMEFWLSGSLSHELFLFFHDGILAIRKSFSRTFFLFSR
jgi:hypothetical protein